MNPDTSTRSAAPTFLASLGALMLLAPTAAAQPVNEDFESSALGVMPGDPWIDVSTRIANPTVPAPTGEVVQTTDHEGNATRAFRINDAVGTSGGILAEVGPGMYHQLSSSVRIDQLASVGGWPISAGFIGPTDGATDFNQAVQLTIYAASDHTWHLFVKKGLGAGQDQVLSGPAWKIGQWYDLDLSFDVATGGVEASVTNLTTGTVEASQSRFVTTWKGNRDMFDAISFSDGEFTTSQTAKGAVTLVDNIAYVPSPSAALPMIGAWGLLRRRRR